LSTLIDSFISGGLRLFGGRSDHAQDNPEYRTRHPPGEPRVIKPLKRLLAPA
jgi:hypothetical protein